MSLAKKTAHKKDVSEEIVGFKVNLEHKDYLQKCANYLYNSYITNPQTGQKERILEQPLIGLLIKQGAYSYIEQMLSLIQNFPQYNQIANLIKNQLEGQQQAPAGNNQNAITR